ncbi:MAG: Gfo/Idh/MocA family oxidoreductase [Myxococcales bacterium]|nr:Gfo/Idh/MocA family oxidoreductase [Myxococcales bacterium]
MSDPSTSEPPISVCVVGAGGWGKNHVRNFALLPGARLAYVCDRSEAVRATIAAAYPETRAVAGLDQALADTELRAVVVATDAPSHFEVAQAALRAGKDVFVEKPLTLDPEESVELVRLANTEGRILMVGHLLLYHPAVDLLKGIVDSGELGDILYITTQRLNLGVVRSTENAWWSLAPHDISVANYLLDAAPVAVSASGGTYLQKERGIEDVVFASLHYPGDRVAHIHVSWLDPHKTRRMTVVGSKKMAVFDDASPDQKVVIFDKGVEPPRTATYEEGVRIRTGDILVPALRMQEPLRRECEAFLMAVRSRRAPLASGESGEAVVRALHAGTRSLQAEGKRVAV